MRNRCARYIRSVAVTSPSALLVQWLRVKTGTSLGARAMASSSPATQVVARITRLGEVLAPARVVGSARADTPAPLGADSA
eukprot:2175964-Pleurochrysis_carterae.AAC.1